jgi:hypothetical protein
LNFSQFSRSFPTFPHLSHHKNSLQYCKNYNELSIYSRPPFSEHRWARSVRSSSPSSSYRRLPHRTLQVRSKIIKQTTKWKCFPIEKWNRSREITTKVQFKPLFRKLTRDFRLFSVFLIDWDWPEIKCLNGIKLVKFRRSFNNVIFSQKIKPR